MINKIKTHLKEWLGINSLEYRINTLEDLLLHKESKLNGFAILKKHLRTKDEKFSYMGKDI